MVAFNAKLCRGMAQVGVAMNAKQRGKFNRGVLDVEDRDDLLRKFFSRCKYGGRVRRSSC